jgi:hypothetical protein
VYESEPKRRSLILLETDLDAKDDHNDDKKSEVEVEEIISPPPGEEVIKSELPKSAAATAGEAGEEEDDGEWEWEYEEEEEEEKAPEEGTIKPEKSPSPTVLSSSYKTTAV